MFTRTKRSAKGSRRCATLKMPPAALGAAFAGALESVTGDALLHNTLHPGVSRQDSASSIHSHARQGPAIVEHTRRTKMWSVVVSVGSERSRLASRCSCDAEADL